MVVLECTLFYKLNRAEIVFLSVARGKVAQKQIKLLLRKMKRKQSCKVFEFINHKKLFQGIIERNSFMFLKLHFPIFMTPLY